MVGLRSWSAVSLNSGSSFPLLAQAVACVSTGDLPVAEECLHLSMRLDPLSPNRNLQLGTLASERLAHQRFAETASLGREAAQLSIAPTFFGLMASAYGYLNEKCAAREALAQLEKLTSISIAQLAAIMY